MKVQKPPFSLFIVSLVLASPQYSCVFFTYNERPENLDTTRGGGGDERRDASSVAQYPGDVLRFRLCVYWSAWQTRQDKRQPAGFHSASFVAKDDPSDEQLHCFVTTSNITAVHPTGKRPVQFNFLHSPSAQRLVPRWTRMTCSERIPVLSIPKLSSNPILPPTTSPACGTVKQNVTHFVLTQVTESTGYCW